MPALLGLLLAARLGYVEALTRQLANLSLSENIGAHVDHIHPASPKEHQIQEFDDYESSKEDEEEERVVRHLVAARRAEEMLLSDLMARKGRRLWKPRTAPTSSAFYSSEGKIQALTASEDEQPPMMAVAAAAAGAALGHRAMQTGEQVAGEIYEAGNRLNTWMEPTSQKGGDATQDVRAYYDRVTAVADADRKILGSISDAPDPAIDQYDPNDHTQGDAAARHKRYIPLESVPLEDPNVEVESGGGKDITKRRKRSEHGETVDDNKLWPSTDVLPAPDEQDLNNTAHTPSPLVWQADDAPPPLPIMLLPIVAFAVGLICLLVMFITDDGPFDRSRHTDRINSVPTFNTKIDAIFGVADRDRDGYVSFQELRQIARLTNPKGASSVTMDWFTDLCRPLGADPQRGLDRAEFRQSYILLGHDVDKDYAIVVERAQQQSDAQRTAGGSVDHSASCSPPASETQPAAAALLDTAAAQPRPAA